MSFIINNVEILEKRIEEPRRTPVYIFKITINEKDLFGKIRYFIDEKCLKNMPTELPRIYNHWELDYDVIYCGLCLNKSDVDKNISQLDGSLKMKFKPERTDLVTHYVREALWLNDKSKVAKDIE